MTCHCLVAILQLTSAGCFFPLFSLIYTHSHSCQLSLQQKSVKTYWTKLWRSKVIFYHPHQMRSFAVGKPSAVVTSVQIACLVFWGIVCYQQHIYSCLLTPFSCLLFRLLLSCSYRVKHIAVSSVFKMWKVKSHCCIQPFPLLQGAIRRTPAVHKMTTINLPVIISLH